MKIVSKRVLYGSFMRQKNYTLKPQIKKYLDKKLGMARQFGRNFCFTVDKFEEGRSAIIHARESLFTLWKVCL
jgi:hypothetical protein